MEKFLFILRESGTDHNEHNTDARRAVHPDLEEWIQSLISSGNFCNGVTIGLSSLYVSGAKMSKSKFLGDADDRILRFDLITAENVDQAVSIAQGCPLVVQGLAEIELRTILELVR
jgi:hypothetical protein